MWKRELEVTSRGRSRVALDVVFLSSSYFPFYREVDDCDEVHALAKVDIPGTSRYSKDVQDTSR